MYVFFAIPIFCPELFYSACTVVGYRRAFHLQYRNRQPYQLLTTKTNEATIAAPI